MIELDELKEKWAEHDRKLDTIIQLNRRLLSAQKLNRAHSALGRLIWWLSVEAVLQLVAVVALGSFIYDHAMSPRFAIPAVILDVLAITVLVALIRQIAVARQVAFDGPVSAIQRQIESLLRERIRMSGWVLLISPLAWTPLFIVGLKGFFDVDVYQAFGVPYVVANIVVGLAVIALAVWILRTFGERLGGVPFVQRMVRDLGGYNLRAAADFLASVTKFESEYGDE